MTLELDTIFNEDCLAGMCRIPDQSVDLVLCDLPYGTTRNKWGYVIPFSELLNKLITCLKLIIDIAGFELTERIQLKDKNHEGSSNSMKRFLFWLVWNITLGLLTPWLKERMINERSC